jgi:molybdopterin-containing oxidoreductase family iron-sulfur binding subunit
VYFNSHFSDKLKNAGKVVFIGTMLNETAELADWVLPLNYHLEDWGDYEPWKGTISLKQPTMQPIYDTCSAGDIFLQLSENNNAHKYTDIVWSNWSEWSHNIVNAEENRKILLKNGFIKTEKPFAKISFISTDFTSIEEHISDSDYFLYASPSLFFFDGRLSNRPWLQEIANPVSNVVWQSWLDMNIETAQKRGISESDIIKISANGKSIMVPVRFSENISPNTVSLETGYGHTHFGKVANNVGVNVFALLNSGNNRLTSVKIEKTGQNEPVLYLHPTEEQYGRHLLQEVKINDQISGNVKKAEITWPLESGYSKDKDLYEPHKHKNHRWAMVIDLQACIGCKACEAACYAENNIPVVGRHHCERGREMSWLKVVPYKISDNKTAFLPLPCQHCDAAPCEPVCPVFASVHNEEGLNAQVYNRCIGTRYCSNNCPYKVRRFNWINIEHEFPETMQLNPEVTVRSRGVMEKCTFCIQRIRNAEYTAKIENRKLKTDEIIPACAQTCPTNAIIFGDLMDEQSGIKKLMENDRHYQLLHELNTKPAVVYLKKIVV